jgi:hypothetical protein
MKLTARNIQASILLWLVVILCGALSTVFIDPLFIGGNTKAMSNLVDNFKNEKRIVVSKYDNNGKYEVIKPPKDYDGSIRYYYNDEANKIQATKDGEQDEKIKQKLADLELKYREQGFKAQY